MTTTIGSLFSGVGGLDLAVEHVYNARTIWHVENDQHAAKVLAAHWPGIPNHGDITTINWANVEPVDILCGGFPCQDISTAGLQAGIKEGTRSGLWYRYADAIRILRPRLVVVENVAALLVRGLGIVLGSLADLGYDARWTCLRASDIGAPHRRNRLFLTAEPADTTSGERLEGAGLRGPPVLGHRHPALTFMPTPRTSDTNEHLLPTPTAAEPGGTVEQYHRRLNAHDGRDATFTPLSMLVQLLPTPTATDAAGSRGHQPDGTPYGPTSGTTLTDAVTSVDWGRYAPAITQWETLTRPAPNPTDHKGRLSPLLPEWMMGLPAGWITDHLGRNAALKCAGNGVLPQQAAAALQLLHQPETAA